MRLPGLVGALMVGTIATIGALAPTRAQLRPASTRSATVRLPPVVEHVAIANPDALDRFRRAATDRREGQRHRLRVMHYGDSNVAAGLWTRRARQRLQSVFGDGGDGFLTALPFGTRPMSQPRLVADAHWAGRRLGDPARFGRPDGLWGLAGVGAEATGRGRMQLEVPAGPARTLEVDLLGWSRGGRVQITTDAETREIDTRRTHPTIVRASFELSEGIAHRVTLRVRSARPVRVLGATLERRSPGLVYDSLGINGQRLNAVNEWNDVLWREHVRGRDPDLVILGYGGNEALDEDLSVTRYTDQLDRSLTRVRTVFPQASCLVVAPVAMCDRPRNAEIIEVQRRAAPAHGCAFWDTSAVSGGPSSLCGWIRHGLVSTDRLHLSPEGYDLIGDRMADALLEVVAPRD